MRARSLLLALLGSVLLGSAGAVSVKLRPQGEELTKAVQAALAADHGSARDGAERGGREPGLRSQGLGEGGRASSRQLVAAQHEHRLCGLRSAAAQGRGGDADLFQPVLETRRRQRVGHREAGQGGERDLQRTHGMGSSGNDYYIITLILCNIRSGSRVADNQAVKLTLDSLGAHLKSGRLAPAYLVSGDEDLLVGEAADAIRAAARAAGYSEREVFTVSGAHFDWSGVLGAAQSMGLFGDQKLIEIRIPSGKPGKDGSAALQQYCDLLPEGVLTLVHLPRLDRQQLQGAWFQALERVGVSVRVDQIGRAHV